MKLNPCWLLLWLVTCAFPAFAQTTAFTFQGTLKAAGMPADGPYDMQFKLYDSEVVGAGAQQGATELFDPVGVAAGVFSVTLDFGANVFDGAPRFLEIGVRPSGSADPYTVLAPRNAITSVPYAIQTLNAQQLGGLPASSYISTSSVGNAFIKNGTTLQTATSFNIDGKGLIGSSLGIGTTPAPGINLDVAGIARVTPGNGGSMSLGAPNGEVGVTELFGSGRADLRFDGSTVKLVAGPVGGPPAASAGLAVNTSGQVLVGADTISDPQIRMLIVAGTTSALQVLADHPISPAVEIFTNGSSAAVDGENSSSGPGVTGYSSSGFGVFSSGYLGVSKLGAAGSTALCLNANSQVAACSSSLRYKKALHSFADGLAMVDKLRPIAFMWKADDARDIGFGAEDVAKVNPLFVTFNESGEVEGVKYDRLSVVFVNAFKEQQAQIRAQSGQIAAQAAEIAAGKTRIETLQAQFDRQQRQLDRLQQAIAGNIQAASDAE